MKFKLLAMVAVCGVFAVGCKTTSTDGAGGGGTGGGSGGSANTVTSTGNTMTTGGVGTCDDIGICDGDGMTPESGCFECSIIGDDTTALDGGACAEDYVACYGVAGDCSDGNPDCCLFDDCVQACPDDDTTTTADENLACLCTPAGSGDVNDVCAATSLAGTCIGDHDTVPPTSSTTSSASSAMARFARLPAPSDSLSGPPVARPPYQRPRTDGSRGRCSFHAWRIVTDQS